jgi:hypothetical protein
LNACPMSWTVEGSRLLDAEIQVPVEIEIALQIGSHQRLAGVAVVQELVEELHDLVAVHGTVEVGRQGCHVDALSPVMRPALLQSLKENGDALFRSRLPALAQ